MVDKDTQIKSSERGFDIKGFWKRLWELLSPAHATMKKVLCWMLVVEITRLAGPYVLKLIIDLITDFSVEKIGEIAALIFVMFLVNETVSILQYTNDKRVFRILADTESN